MLIISDFHDYYDHAAAYGVDKTVVYRRKQETVQEHHVPHQGDIKDWSRDSRRLTTVEKTLRQAPP